MTETYIEETDTLLIEFNVNATFQRIHPVPGLIVLLGEDGKPCGIELENAAAVLGDMEYLMVQEVDAIESPLDVDDFQGFSI